MADNKQDKYLELSEDLDQAVLFLAGCDNTKMKEDLKSSFIWDQKGYPENLDGMVAMHNTAYLGLQNSAQKNPPTNNYDNNHNSLFAVIAEPEEVDNNNTVVDTVGDAEIGPPKDDVTPGASDKTDPVIALLSLPDSDYKITDPVAESIDSRSNKLDDVSINLTPSDRTNTDINWLISFMSTLPDFASDPASKVAHDVVPAEVMGTSDTNQVMANTIGDGAPPGCAKRPHIHLLSKYVLTVVPTLQMAVPSLTYFLHQPMLTQLQRLATGSLYVSVVSF